MARRDSPYTDALLRTARLFRIITLIAGRRPGTPLGRRELADACSCDVRTIQRDLNLLSTQAPFEYDPGERAYVLPEKGWRFPLVEMTLQDALAFSLLRGLTALPGVPAAAEVRTALDKASAGLTPPLRQVVDTAAESLRRSAQTSRMARDYTSAPVLPIMEAVTTQITVEIEYASRSGDAASTPAWRRVDPYAVAPREGIFWEMHGWCHRNHEVRTFSLDHRFSAVRSTGEPFTVREAEWRAFLARPSVRGLRGAEAVAVDVLFAPPVAAYAQDWQWPPGLRTELLLDGNVRLYGEAFSLDGLVVELLRWRRHARVVGGPELWGRMAAEIQAMAELYATEPAGGSLSSLPRDEWRGT